MSVVEPAAPIGDAVDRPRADDELPVTWAGELVVASADFAECTCPEWCDRDHDRD
jgi:hypothetical protein